MALNIKNEEAHRLARQLAQRNGETVTMAVVNALKERLERQEKAAKREGRLEWLLKLSERTAPLLKDLPPSDTIGDLLFDKETGLPLCSSTLRRWSRSFDMSLNVWPLPRPWTKRIPFTCQRQPDCVGSR